ncbi:MAG: hypothetical protein IR159_09980 [Brevundimonas sp.]|nr:hypothetical protein [Brevundimonas sp.]
MLHLLVALAVVPAVQEAPPEAPRRAQVGELIVSNGGMMAWDGGQVLFEVENGGAEADRIVSIATPAGTVGEIILRTIAVNSERSAEGDLSIRPGRTRVFANLTAVGPDRRQPFQTTVAVVFERAGEVTILATPVAPAPHPRPPGGQ